MLRLLCFFRLLFDWDAVKTKRKGVGEWRVRSGYANLCCVIKKKKWSRLKLGIVYIWLFAQLWVLLE